MPNLKEQLEAIAATGNQTGNIVIPTRSCCWIWYRQKGRADLSTLTTAQTLLENIRDKRMDLDSRVNSNTFAPAYSDIILAFLVGGVGIASTILDNKTKANNTHDYDDAKIALSSVVTGLGLGYAVIKGVCSVINTYESIPFRDELVEAEDWLMSYMKHRWPAGDAVLNPTTVDNKLAEASSTIADAIVLNIEQGVPYIPAPAPSHAPAPIDARISALFHSFFYKVGAKLQLSPTGPAITNNMAQDVMNYRV